VQLKQQLNLPELSPVHRIDRETAGLVVFSVRAQDRNAYQELFRLRQVDKIYEAIAGAPETSALNPKFPLVHRSLMDEDIQFFRMRELITDGSHSHNEFNSETWIDCVERISTQEIAIQTDGIKELALARYQLKPVTGQRHQLRVHMNALGLPLLGDQFYPLVRMGAEENDNFEHPLQLLAKSIFFKDPISGFLRSFTSSLILKILT
jgi:tRNA pseudouridine32 synthase/23S rRNA pseudouridine746 synthase